MHLTTKYLAIGLIFSAFLVTHPEPAQADTGVTPGTTTFYSFPSGTPLLNDVTFGITVLTDPGRSKVYWANQFNFTGQVAYVGMQRLGDKPGMFLFSVWNATDARSPDTRSECSVFQEGGSGRSCRRQLDFTAGHGYQFKIGPDGDGWYKATVTDVTNGQSFVLGSIQVGARAKLKPDGMVSFVEYIDWNDLAARCGDEPYSRASFEMPRGNGGTLRAASSGVKVNAPCRGRVVEGLHEDGLGASAAGSIAGSTGKCIKVNEGGRTDNLPMSLSPCANTRGQTWVLAGDATIHSLYKCMSASGSAVQLSTCNGAKTQMWELQNGTLVNQATKTCLTGSADASLTLAVCAGSGSANQRWTTPPGNH